MSDNHLQWLDYLVIAVTMIISVGIGLYYRQQKTTQQYFSANKSMGIFPVAVALMVSFMSAITLLGVSGENYTYGAQFAVINLAYLIGTPIICYGFLPVFYNLGAVSAYEYLEKRFGYGARVTASFCSWVQLFLYSGVVLYAPALALKATTGLSVNWSMIGIGLVCAFYSTIGGIKAVLITDVFQAFLMFVSLFIVIIHAALNVGGLGEVWRRAEEGKRINFDNFSLDPTVRHTWWGLIIGGLFTYLSLFGVNQIQVQRMMTLKSMKSSRTALWLQWPILTFLSLLTCFSGLAIYSYYYKCDPIESKNIQPDMLLPLYVMENLSQFPGIPGLFIAGIFSAGLSTISAGLNSLAAVTLEDYIKPLYARASGNEFSESRSIILSKVLVLFFGLACIATGFAAQELGGILQASLSIFGLVGGPLLGIFTLGMLVESANEIGSIIGVISSLIFSLCIAFGQPRPIPPRLSSSTEDCPIEKDTNAILSSYLAEAAMAMPKAQSALNSTCPEDPSSCFYLYRISYIWYSAIGFVITMIVGIAVSYISRIIYKKQEFELDPELFFPFVANRMKKRRQRTGSL